MLSFSYFFDRLKNSKPIHLVVAAAEDETVIAAIYRAWNEKIIIPVLIGDKTQIDRIIHEHKFDFGTIEIINEPVREKACKIAADLIVSGRGDILMKGLINTSVLIKAVLEKKKLMVPENTILSHFALFESHYYHKLLAITDAGINIQPDFDQKVRIIMNAVNCYHTIGIECPKIAALSAVEKVNLKIQSSVDAEILKKMNMDGSISGCIIEGPLALDNAVSMDAARHKNIQNQVAGDADLLFVPDIVSGNILYKSLNFLGGAKSAGLVIGAKVPIVLTSRADSDESKLNSIAIAACIKKLG